MKIAHVSLLYGDSPGVEKKLVDQASAASLLHLDIDYYILNLHKTENIGTVLSIRSSVVEARFPKRLPALNSILQTGDDEDIVIEVLTHIDAKTVRGIALTSTEGLAQNARIIDTGRSFYSIFTACISNIKVRENYSFGNGNIPLASSTLATSSPNSRIMRAAFSTSSALLFARTPFDR